MVEYYDEFQIGEYDNGEPISIHGAKIYATTPTIEEETHVTIYGTLK